MTEGRVRTMNEVLKEAFRNYKPRHGAVVEIGTEDKETGRMANLTTTEEWEKLEESQRNERVAIERGRQVEDLLHRCIGDVADARAHVHRLSKQGVELENKLCQSGRRLDRARLDMLATREWMEKLHYKVSPRHFKKPGSDCSWCTAIAKLIRAVQEAGR